MVVKIIDSSNSIADHRMRKLFYEYESTILFLFKKELQHT